MNDERRERLGRLLEQALNLAPEPRRRFLHEACGDDGSLEAEVASLAAAADAAGPWLERGADVIPAGTVVSRYEVLERVGGGMGVVYRARDRELGRSVALKFLPPGHAADPRARERLLTEARAASALDHPNIGTVYEIGDAGTRGLYIALAWYEGETLKQRLERGPLPVAEAIVLARQLAGALAAAHRAGIVHRDVKPSNIILTAPDAPRLVDFGIAKVAGTDLTMEGSTLGTVAYMSPEQTRGTGVDIRTDLWSLGIVLYEMLAGRRPFEGESDATLIHAIRHDMPAPLAAVRPDTPSALAAIVEVCLAKDRNERFASADELITELDIAERGGAGGAILRKRRRQRARRFGGWRVVMAGGAVAAAVAAALYASGGTGGGGRDLTAERHYLLGRYHWSQRTEQGFDSAIHHFSEAIRRDPRFARAYAGLADVYVLGAGPAGSDGPRLAIGAARSALRLDPDLAAAHASLGFALMSRQEWAASDSSFRRAIALDPNYATAHQWYAELLASQGRLDEAVEHVRLAEELDRGSAIIGWNVARILGFARRRDEELAQLQRLAPMYPGDERIVMSLAEALVARKEYAEAATTLERFLGAMPAALSEPGRAQAVRALLDNVRSGDGDALLRYYLELQPPGTGSDGHQRMFAAAERVLAGDMDGALGLIEELDAVGGPGIGTADLAVGSFFDRFRDEERFQQVLRDMGLDPEVGLRLRRSDPAWLGHR